MPRRIGENVRNELIIPKDPISGTRICLYYRLPTTEERQAYFSGWFDRDKDRVRVRIVEARQEHGLRILEGFSDDSFERWDSVEKKWKPVSSDPGSPDFYPEWREWIKGSPDLIEALASHAFESLETVASQEDLTEKN